jgi:hypothetical protein
MLEMIRWWYGRGWSDCAANAKQRLVVLADTFSVAILLRTLFAPWKRIITYPGAGLEAYFRAMLDNLVSRFIGFFVRIGVLLSAAIVFVLCIVIGFLQIIAWPLVPFAGLALIVWGMI